MEHFLVIHKTDTEGLWIEICDIFIFFFTCERSSAKDKRHLAL